MNSRLFWALPYLIWLGLWASIGNAFPGFYVSKTEGTLLNRSTRIVYVRNGNQNTVTVLNDYKGDADNFALVIPVPVVLRADQVKVVDIGLIERLDRYSAPRLVERFDPDPCESSKLKASEPLQKSSGSVGTGMPTRFSVGEYEISILSAKDSFRLERWLKKNDYRLPGGFSKAISPFVRRGMYFFVVEVNLARLGKKDFQYLRPIQFTYEEKGFSLPVGLGHLNVGKFQDFTLYLISPKGRVEPVGLEVIEKPTEQVLPTYVKYRFDQFYEDLFTAMHRRESNKTLFLEYAGEMASCEACASPPLSKGELEALGVGWLAGDKGEPPVFLTRLRGRRLPNQVQSYLKLKPSEEKEPFQVSFAIQYPWESQGDSCSTASSYREALKDRHEQEAETLVSLTGWARSDVTEAMNASERAKKKQKWYEKIFN